MHTYFTEKREATEENFYTFSPINLSTYPNLYLDFSLYLAVARRNYLWIYHLILTSPTYLRKSVHKLSYFNHVTIFFPNVSFTSATIIFHLGKRNDSLIPHFLQLQLHFSVPILLYFFLVLEKKKQRGKCTDWVGGTGMECTSGGCTGGGAKVGWGSQFSHFISCKIYTYIISPLL